MELSLDLVDEKNDSAKKKLVNKTRFIPLLNTKTKLWLKGKTRRIGEHGEPRRNILIKTIRQYPFQITR